MNPYEILDVPPDASPPVIRKAYRRKARSVHPDTGGTPEEFALVKRSHDILTDPVRREKYDRTGDASETTVDNTVTHALQMVNVALDEALGEIANQGREPHKAQALVDHIRRRLVARRNAVNERVGQVTKGIAVNERLAGRFRVKEGENRLEALILGRIATMRAMQDGAKLELAHIEVAIGIVDAHTFRADPEEARDPMQNAMSVMFQMGRF